MKKSVFLMLWMLLSITTYAQTADVIIGKWLTQDADSHIEITKRNGKYYGRVVWLKYPNRENGSIKLDDKNPDLNMRSRKILGLEILQNFVFEEGTWEDGTIYDPTSGKTYSCELQLSKDGKLEVTGYIGFSWIGKTVYWTKVG